VLQNRLAFDSNITSATTAKTRKWFSSLEAPFQKFWWVDFPPETEPGDYEYEVTLMRFVEAHSAKLAPDQQVTIDVSCRPFKQGNFELAFTRGYLSSQAYTDRFNNADIRPRPKNIDYDSKPYWPQYEWLGAHARETLIAFLTRCHDNPDSRLDVMLYDVDEPDMIRALASLGTRVRYLLDNASLHTKAGALEPKAKAVFEASAAAGNVKVGRFDRYQHNKVFILYENDVAVSVLTGSTNISINGLYVNANHIAVFNDAAVAQLYQQMFETAFAGNLKAGAFEQALISKKEYEINTPGLPHTVFSFAPHTKPTFSLDRLLAGLQNAASSVLFAVMELKGQGAVLDMLRAIHRDGKIFSYGVTDNPGPQGDGAPGPDGVTVFSPGKAAGVLIDSAALNKLVPPPFSKEKEEGLAHKVHHKFVVLDFNGANPVVFFGSSNLANLGEQENGDNLIAMYDRDVATVFAIEAIRLVDHYAFRAAMKTATDTAPMRLRYADEHWHARYFEAGNIKLRERLLFSR
jgi:hypothetical protein